MRGVSLSGTIMRMTTATMHPVSGSGSLREQVAEDVRAALARRRVSGAALARLVGHDQTWMSRRLRGAVPFDLDDLETIARVLDIDVDVLLRPRRGALVAGGTQPTVHKVRCLVRPRLVEPATASVTRLVPRPRAGSPSPAAA